MNNSSLCNQPDFERFRTALYGGEPDRVPVAEGHIDPEIKEAFLGRKLKTAADDIAFWQAAGYDYALIRVGGQPVPDTVTSHGGEAPGRDSGPEMRWATSGRGAVSTMAEFERYPWIGVDQVDFRPLDEYARQLPAAMKIVLNVGPLFSGVWRTMGLESFVYATEDNGELIAALHEKFARLILDIAARALAHPAVGGIWLGDDIAFAEALFVSPAILRRYAFPWYGRLGELCRSAGKPLVYHSDGNLTEVLDDLVAAGISALNPIEPKAMDITAIKRLYGSRLCLIGNVDVDLLSRGTTEQVVRETLRLLREVAPGGGYCLGSANSIPYYVPMANWRAMVNTALERGRYPIAPA